MVSSAYIYHLVIFILGISYSPTTSNECKHHVFLSKTIWIFNKYSKSWTRRVDIREQDQDQEQGTPKSRRARSRVFKINKLTRNWMKQNKIHSKVLNESWYQGARSRTGGLVNLGEQDQMCARLSYSELDETKHIHFGSLISLLIILFEHICKTKIATHHHK